MGISARVGPWPLVSVFAGQVAFGCRVARLAVRSAIDLALHGRRMNLYPGQLDRFTKTARSSNFGPFSFSVPARLYPRVSLPIPPFTLAAFRRRYFSSHPRTHFAAPEIQGTAGRSIVKSKVNSLIYKYFLDFHQQIILIFNKLEKPTVISENHWLLVNEKICSQGPSAQERDHKTKSYGMVQCGGAGEWQNRGGA